jgi:hypothetical protein
MYRRELLVLLAVGGSGCTVETATPPPGGVGAGGGERTVAGSTAPSRTSAPGRTPTSGEPTSRPTPTEEETPTPTEETPTPTEESTPTPDRAERAQAEIDAAKKALGDAVSAYEAAAGGNATLLDVDVGTDFEEGRLKESLRTATDHLERARGLATAEQEEDVQQLTRATIWLRYLARAQAAAHTAYERYREARVAIYRGDTEWAANVASKLDPLIGPIESRLARATEGVSPSDMQVVPGVDAELFEEKNRQLRRAVAGFGFVADEVEPAAQAVGRFATATDTFIGIDQYSHDYSDQAREQYARAQDEYRAAETALNDSVEALAEQDFSPSTIQGWLDTLDCSLSAVAEAADQMQISAQAASNGRAGVKKTFLKAAKDELKGTGCDDTVRELAEVKELLDH